MPKPIIAIDVDDVVVNFNQTILERVNKHFGVDYRFNDLTWNFINLKEEHFNYAHSLFDDLGVHESLVFLDGAKEFVLEAAELCEVVFLTSVYPKAIPYRDEMLKILFPNLEYSVIYTSRKDLVKVDIMIDDASHHVLKNNSGLVMMLSRPWNLSVTEAHLMGRRDRIRVPNYSIALQEIKSFITKNRDDF